MEKKSVLPIILRGVILIILGLIMMLQDENSIRALGVIPGLIIAMIGLAQVAFAYFAKKNLTNWKWYLLGGAAIVVIGVVLMLNPKFTLTLFTVAFGAWFLFQAFQDLMAAKFWKKHNHTNWWMLIVSGVLNLLIGILFIFNPAKGAMVITTFIGLGMIFGGIMALATAIMLRKIMNAAQEIEN